MDALEVEDEPDIAALIALHQPVASDLRQILTTLKISNDIERVGDHGVNIAKAARRLAGLPPLPDTPEVMELAVLSQRVLRDALASIGARDSGLARKVCARDDRVDDLSTNISEEVVFMVEGRSIKHNAERLRDLPPSPDPT